MLGLGTVLGSGMGMGMGIELRLGSGGVNRKNRKGLLGQNY